MRGSLAIAILGLLALLAPTASAAAPCETATTVADRVVPAGDCLRLGPGASVTGTLAVDGRLEIAGTTDAPVTVSGTLILRGEPVTVAGASFTGATGILVGAPGRKTDLVLTDSTFVVPAQGRGVTVTDSFRIEIARTTFSGPGTAIYGVSNGRGSSLDVADSTFAGPGQGVLLTLGGQGGERITLSGNTFRGEFREVGSDYDASLGLVTIRGGPGGKAGGPATIALSGNTFEENAAGVVLESSNYRLLSTGDTFRRLSAGVVVLVEGRNSVFDRTTFTDITQHHLVLPSTGDALVKDPIAFDAGKVLVSRASVVSVREGASATEITYDWMMAHRAEAAAGAAGVAVVGLLLTSLGRSLFVKLLFVPLYARFSAEETLNHEKRQQILQYVSDHPGVHLRRIGHELGFSYGTLTYHLHRLEREGFLAFSQEGFFKRYYSSAGRMREAAKEHPLPTALRDLERQIYETIVLHPGSAQSEIAGKLGLSRQALHYHIKKLERDGYIMKLPRGRETLIYPAQGGAVPASVADATKRDPGAMTGP